MSAILFWSVGLFVLVTSPAIAQSRQLATETRYFLSLNDVMDGQADIILKETRQGERVTAASLDMCYPTSHNSDHKDRFVVDLTINGQTLVGSTQTLRGKSPVKVMLTQRGSVGNYEFKGQISAGDLAVNVASTENSDVSEQEYRENIVTEDNIVASPKDFTEVSPESLAVKLKLDAVADFIKSLRGENVELSLESLMATCSELRTGEQVIYLSVDPERAPSVLAKLQKVPGVITSGWTDGHFEMERTLRLTAAPWIANGKIDRNRFASELSDVLTKALSAQSASHSWDDTSGKLTLKLKRPFAAMPDIGLTDTLEFSALISRDKPGSSDHLILWLSTPVVTTADESGGTRLHLYDATSGDEEGSEADDGGALGALAQALKAQRWDSTRSVWR